MKIGPYLLDNPLFLAPMAGVADRPFRQLCRELGVGMAVSEMLSSNPRVWSSEKSQQRMDHTGETGVRSVQIAGADPELMAAAAQHNVKNGAQINHYLKTGERLPVPSVDEVRRVILQHVENLHQFYGEFKGVRFARKHVSWYIQHQVNGVEFRNSFNALESSAEQHLALMKYFDDLS